MSWVLQKVKRLKVFLLGKLEDNSNIPQYLSGKNRELPEFTWKNRQ